MQLAGHLPTFLDFPKTCANKNKAPHHYHGGINLPCWNWPMAQNPNYRVEVSDTQPIQKAVPTDGR